MALKITNNASTLLAASIDAEDTEIAVSSGAGAMFPSLQEGDWFPLVVIEGAGIEIMRATARAGDVITVARAQEGTTARIFDAGARVDLRLTAAAMAVFPQPPFGPDQLATSAVITEKVADEAITAPKLGAAAVLYAKFQNIVGLSIFGRASNSEGVGAAITAATDGHVLRRKGTALGFGQIETAGYGDNSITFAKLIEALQLKLVPTGSIWAFPATTAPASYLKADGAEISRTTYADLWAYAQVSGNLAATEAAKEAGQFGPGDGSTTFTLPNYENEFIRGAGGGRTLGTVQAQAIQAHRHRMPYRLIRTSGSGSISGSGSTYGFDTNPDTDSTGGSETRPRNVSVLYCIKT